MINIKLIPCTGDQCENEKNYLLHNLSLFVIGVICKIPNIFLIVAFKRLTDRNLEKYYNSYLKVPSDNHKK